MPRRLLTVLIFGLPLLGTAFVVVMGGYLLTSATGDESAATVLRWIGAALLMLIAGDALLLVAMQGIALLADQESNDHHE